MLAVEAALEAREAPVPGRSREHLKEAHGNVTRMLRVGAAKLATTEQFRRRDEFAEHSLDLASMATPEEEPLPSGAPRARNDRTASLASSRRWTSGAVGPEFGLSNAGQRLRPAEVGRLQPVAPRQLRLLSGRATFSTSGSSTAPPTSAGPPERSKTGLSSQPSATLTSSNRCLRAPSCRAGRP